MSPLRRWGLLTGGTLALVAGVLAVVQNLPSTSPQVADPAPLPRTAEAVAALGQLEPSGEVRRLAAPSAGLAGSARMAQLLVAEGETVRQGQVLARFDSRYKALARLASNGALQKSLEREIGFQRVEVERYSRAANGGAASLVLLETKQAELGRLEGQLLQARAERGVLQVDLRNSELRSPIDGLVLRVHAQVGERPGSDGVMEVGASQRMQARIEVYESDISRISIDQPVTLTSENGGFQGELRGRVASITPQVQQRQVLSTDPTGDADARVVKVTVALDQRDAERVSRLSGLKVIARFGVKA